MKICSRCKTEKDDREFSFSNKTHTKLNSFCKTCHNEWGRSYFQKNRQRIYTHQRNRRNKLKSFIKTYLESHPCIDCGCSDIRVLQFDHVRGKKVKGISTFWTKELAIGRLEEEMKKCEIRCANCHIIRHHEERRKGNLIQFESE